MIRSLLKLTTALLLCGAFLAIAYGQISEARLDPACPPGLWDLDLLNKDDGHASHAARKLLENPNFGASPEAAGDLEAGIVDERLVATLRIITREHRICVDAFKEGHYFVPGVPDVPRIPEGYGKAGGLPNTPLLRQGRRRAMG